MRHSNLCTRASAALLSATMLIGSVDVTGFKSLAAESGHANQLNNWKVESSWGNYSDTYSWHADTAKNQNFKLSISYKADPLTDADREYYEPGSIIFKVPGLGGANRASIKRASSLPSDHAESEWSCVWDETTDTYTFSNKSRMSTQSINGGFEVVWTLSSRDTINGYEQDKSVIFSVDGEEITLPPLHFDFTSTPDIVQIGQLTDDGTYAMGVDYLSVSDYRYADPAYAWYTLTTQATTELKAREVLSSQYYVKFVLPDGVATDDIKIMSGGSEQTLDDQNGFYPFKDRKGTLSGEISSFRIGFKREAFNVLRDSDQDTTITAYGHLDRLYQDDEDWTTRKLVEADQIDTITKIPYDEYFYDYKEPDDYEWVTSDGYYSYLREIYKYSPYGGSGNSGRLLASKIYSGETVRFTPGLSFSSIYHEPSGSLVKKDQTASQTLTGADGETTEAIANEAEEPVTFALDGEGVARLAVEAEDTVEGSDEIAVQSVTAPEFKITKDSVWDLMIGDDVLLAQTKNGAYRRLDASEYDMQSIFLPQSKYPVQVYTTTDTDAGFDEYTLYKKYDRIGYNGINCSLPDDTKAAYIKVTGIVGLCKYEPVISVNFHLDVNAEAAKAEEEKIDPNGKIYNIAYFKMLYTSDDGSEQNDLNHDNYPYSGIYYEEMVAHDTTVYGEILARAAAPVNLAEEKTDPTPSNPDETPVTPYTYLTVNAGISKLTGAKKDGYTSTITSRGTIESNTNRETSKFSLYSVVDKDLQIDPNTDISISGIAYDTNGNLVTINESNTEVNQLSYQGMHGYSFDFDFTDTPLDQSKRITVTITYQVSLSHTDQQDHIGSYETDTYMMIQDAGVTNLKGRYLAEDIYDIDNDGNATETIAQARATTSAVQETATEWREYSTGFVKSAYTGSYASEAIAKVSTDDADSKSKYTYRLDLGLGSSYAKNITFFDSLEQGADTESGKEESDWQGYFQAIDTSKITKIGGKTTVYYSTVPTTSQNLSDACWTTEAPLNPATVKAVAVHIDTSDMRDGMMDFKTSAVITIDMVATSDTSKIKTYAVNQATITYDAYNLSAVLEEEQVTLKTAPIKVQLLSDVGNVTLKKVDYDTDKAVAGAVFTIYDADGNVITKDRRTTTTGTITLRNLPYGTYYYEETTVPDGYLKPEGTDTIKVDGVDHKVFSFTVSADSEIIKIPNVCQRGSITLTKKDSTDSTHAPLAGATFKLYTEDGDQCYFTETGNYSKTGEYTTVTTGADGTLTIGSLPWGNYYLTETEAPDGYLLSSDKITFTIDKNHLDVKVDAGNVEKTATVTLKKLDAETHQTIKGAVFNLLRKSTSDTWTFYQKGLKTDALGEITVSNLPFGEYKFVETQPAPGYKLPDDPEGTGAVTFTLDPSTAETTIKLTMENDRLPGSAKLRKFSENGTTLLTGATYRLYRSDDTVVTFTDTYEASETAINTDLVTGEYGETPTVKNLPWGSYYFRETTAPEGYELSDDKLTFTINKANASSTTAVVTDGIDKRVRGTVILTKLDAATKQIPLQGAKFVLYAKDGAKIKSEKIADGKYQISETGTETIYTTSTTGTIEISNLDWGSYYFKETKAPEGYGLTEDLTPFVISQSNCNTTQNVTCYDPLETGSIRIKKTINDQYSGFGKAQFLFKISGTDYSGQYHKWIQLLTIDESNSGEVVVADVPRGVYKVEEVKVGRYELQKAEVAVSSGIVDEDGVATVNVANQEETVAFINNLSDYSQFSHNSSETNIVNAFIKLTGLKVTYIGSDPIASESEHTYIFTEGDIKATAFYDDGTDTEIPFTDLTLSSDKVTGNDNPGKLITVSYTDHGITTSDSFAVQVSLQEPPNPITVTFDANGGGFASGELSNGVTYVWKKQVPTTKIAHTENLDDEGNSNGTAVTDYESSLGSTWTVRIPGSESLDITLTQGGDYREFDWVAVYDTSITPTDSNYADSLTGKIGDRGTRTETITVTGDTAQIYAHFTKANWAVANRYGFYAVVKGFENHNEAITGTYEDPTQHGKVFLGWYTDPDCTDGNEFTEDDYLYSELQGDITVYAKWRDQEATLDTGSNVNTKFRALANSNSRHDRDETNIKAIVEAAELPTGQEMTDANIISAGDSEVPVYAWFDKTTGTMYYHSTAKDIYLNPDSSYMLKQYRNLASIEFMASWKADRVVNLSNMFDTCTSLASLKGLENWDTSNVQEMKCAFYACAKITALDELGNWHTSNVTDIVLRNDYYKQSWGLFQNCTSLKDATGISNWKLPKVTDFQKTFLGCKVLTTIGHMDISAAQKLDYFFDGCTSLSDLSGLSTWDVSNVISMPGLFNGCSSITTLAGIESWDTKNVTTITANNQYGTFANMTGLKDTTAIATWELPNVTDFTALFYGDTNLVKVGHLDTSAATNLYRMFYNCYNLTDIDGMATWDVSKLQSLYQTFWECRSLSDLTPLASWKTTSLTNLQDAFKKCYGIMSLEPLSTWDTSHVTNMVCTFDQCKSLINLKGLETWDTSKVEKIGYDGTQALFANMISLEDASAISTWKLPKVASFRSLFYNDPALVAVPTIDTQAATSMETMFQGDTSLTDISFIKTWDISKVTTMNAMFYQSGVVNADFSHLNLPKLTNAYRLFANCKSLETVDFTNTNAPLLNTLSNAFAADTKLISADFTGATFTNASGINLNSCFNGDTSLQTITGLGATGAKATDLAYFVNDCRSLQNLGGLAGLDTSKTSSIYYFARNCSSITSVEPIKDFVTTSLKDYRSAFDGCGSLITAKPLDALDVTAGTNFTNTFANTNLTYETLPWTDHGTWANGSFTKN